MNQCKDPVVSAAPVLGLFSCNQVHLSWFLWVIYCLSPPKQAWVFRVMNNLMLKNQDETALGAAWLDCLFKISMLAVF